MMSDGHWLRWPTCLLCLVCPWNPEISWHWRGVEGVQAEVVVRPIDVVPNQPSSHASDQDVGGEVLFRKHSACTHSGCQPIDRSACNPARIFISNYCCERPCRGRVIRRKRRLSGARTEEVPFSVVYEWTITQGYEFPDFTHGQAVGYCFAGKQACLVSPWSIAE